MAVFHSGTKIETQRCDEVLADADQKLSQLGSELAQAKQAHEQALLRQQEHASQTERQLEVHIHCQLTGLLTGLIIMHACSHDCHLLQGTEQVLQQLHTTLHGCLSQPKLSRCIVLEQSHGLQRELAAAQGTLQRQWRELTASFEDQLRHLELECNIKLEQAAQQTALAAQQAAEREAEASAAHDKERSAADAAAVSNMQK